MNRDAEIITFGCRLNIYESEILKQGVKDNNIENTSIFNSCAVTSETCLLYTSPSPRDRTRSRMPSSA